MPAPKSATLDELAQVARRLRGHIIRMTTAAGSGHPTSSLSAVEIVTSLYFGGRLRFDPRRPQWPDRDRFILSKGHAAPVLYAALAEAGYFSVEELPTLRQLGSRLEGHPNLRRLPGVEASTGSLGQGLSIGLGHALAGRVQRRRFRVYVLLGDGEIDEGQVWEAAAAAAHFKVANLTAIVDRNGYQQTGATSRVLSMEPLVEKFAAFGWDVREIDGHDLSAVGDALDAVGRVGDRPQAIVARTVKGYGILPLLDEAKDSNYHGKALPALLAEKALALVERG